MSDAVLRELLRSMHEPTAVIVVDQHAPSFACSSEGIFHDGTGQPIDPRGYGRSEKRCKECNKAWPCATWVAVDEESRWRRDHE